MKKPCKECPFLKTSLPGYLGACSGDPESFLRELNNLPMPCHMAVKWDKGEDGNNKRYSNTCVGSLQFQKNSLKQPYDKTHQAMVDLAKKNPAVFNFRHEFIEHHKQFS